MKRHTSDAVGWGGKVGHREGERGEEQGEQAVVEAAWGPSGG